MFMTNHRLRTKLPLFWEWGHGTIDKRKEWLNSRNRMPSLRRGESTGRTTRGGGKHGGKYCGRGEGGTKAGGAVIPAGHPKRIPAKPIDSEPREQPASPGGWGVTKGNCEGKNEVPKSWVWSYLGTSGVNFRQQGSSTGGLARCKSEKKLQKKIRRIR